MARQKGSKLQKNFIKGLITETTTLTAPDNACQEAWNVEFDFTGRIGRRLGIDFETNAIAYNPVRVTNEGSNEYLWTSVGGDGDVSFLCVHKGSFVHFYDVSNSVVSVANQKKSFVIDLSAYLVSGSTLTVSDYPIKFAQGNGNLICVNKAITPILVKYDSSTDSITVSVINLKARDFQGVEDGLDAATRPTGTVAALKTSNPNHYYNLLNQGWHSTTRLS